MCPVRLLLIGVFSTLAMVGCFFYWKEGVEGVSGSFKPSSTMLRDLLVWRPKMRPLYAILSGALLVGFHLWLFQNYMKYDFIERSVSYAVSTLTPYSTYLVR